MNVLSVECLVVGGGPAGLTAALYLGRFRRNVLLVDAGQSRARWIPKTHNLIGYTDGITGLDLLARMRSQAQSYGARIMDGDLHALAVEGDWQFTAQVGDTAIRARSAIIATGGLDVEPVLPGIRAAVDAGLVRYCPICDAFEAQGKRIGLISYGKCRLKEALLLRSYSSHLTVLTLGHPMEIDAAEAQLLESRGIVVERAPVQQMRREGAEILVTLEGPASPMTFDTVYCALGTEIRSGLATKLSVAADEDGALQVDRHQRTHIPGLYAAGDVVQGLSQISVSAAQAAVAAVDINAHLLATSAGLA